MPHRDFAVVPLAPGVVVNVYQDGRLLRTGLIDEVAADLGLVWICQDGNDTRKIYDLADGFEIVPEFVVETEQRYPGL